MQIRLGIPKGNLQSGNRYTGLQQGDQEDDPSLRDRRKGLREGGGPIEFGLKYKAVRKAQNEAIPAKSARLAGEGLVLDRSPRPRV